MGCGIVNRKIRVPGGPFPLPAGPADMTAVSASGTVIAARR
jgi:hypothetical protein